MYIYIYIYIYIYSIKAIITVTVTVNDIPSSIIINLLFFARLKFDISIIIIVEFECIRWIAKMIIGNQTKQYIIH